ncbi:MAG TPA: hypothetical protein VIS29_05690 [Streptomyces sp.]|jgi:hypothetical protein
MALDENIGNKHPGDPIRSDDWNKLSAETRRLDAAKLDTGGGTITGPLTVRGPISSPALGVQMLHGNPDAWIHNTSSSTYEPTVARDVTFESAASMLVIGHCNASTTPSGGIQMVLSVDDVQLHQVEANSALSWGMAMESGYSQGDGPRPLVTMGICTVTPGVHNFKLLLRATSEGQTVQAYGSTVFLLQIGH